MSATVNWGILGAGSIAKAIATGLGQSRTGKLLAVASRSQEKADKFGAERNVPRRYGSYEALLNDKDVDVVYVCTPHPLHARWAIRAIEAGKNVLVEKPFALNAPQAAAIFEAAREAGVFAMEAFMYRCNPQTAKVIELIRQGAIGSVGVIQATFSFHSGFNPDGRLWSNAMAGGGIMDVGCYAVSMCRLIAGAATGKPCADPIAVTGAGKLNDKTRVDEFAVGTLKFPGDIVATIATGVGINQENVVRIFGSDGSIFLPNPWVANRETGETSKIIVKKKGAKEPEEIVIETKVTSFSMEADVVGEAVLAGKKQADSPAMSWGDTLGNMTTLDQWRAAVGVVYEPETPKALEPVHGRPLAFASSPRASMKYGQIAGVSKKVSRLIMGVDNIVTPGHTFVLWDDFFERGGNVWDSAWIYGGGKAEGALGTWVNTRGVREQVVILDKGAHTPMCTPDGLKSQHKESLSRLGMTYVDIYMMHRDNSEVPVGEFVDVLYEQVKAGTMRAIGGSNFSIERIEAFNEYARKNGKTPFAAVSNNLSLAYMNNPVWGGCITASKKEYRDWHSRTQMPLMPWSSQARGFFTDRGDPSNTSDKEMNRVWQSPENQQRRTRAYELASKRGVEPIQIALAWVLCQPFPTFPLIGPRQLSETHSSMKALSIELTGEEIKWLNLE